MVTPSLDGDILAVLALVDQAFSPGQLHRMLSRHSEDGIRRALRRLAFRASSRPSGQPTPTCTGSAVLSPGGGADPGAGPDASDTSGSLEQRLARNDTRVLELSESEVLGSPRHEPVLRDVVAHGLTVAGKADWMPRALRAKEPDDAQKKMKTREGYGPTPASTEDLKKAQGAGDSLLKAARAV